MTVRTGRFHKPATREPRNTANATTGGSGKGINLALLVLALWGSVHAFVMLGVETSRSFESRREIVRLTADVGELKAELGGLQAVVAHAGDPVYREQLARCLGFIYPDETRYLTRVETNEPIISKSICH